MGQTIDRGPICATSSSMRTPAPLLAVLLLVACSKGDVTADSPAPTGSQAPLADAELGKPAPVFTLPTLDGDTVELSDHRGKIVVLEWFNPDCPFVNQDHLKGSLKGLAKRHASNGVVWIAVNSNAEGKQGHAPERNRQGRSRFGIDYPIALDRDGRVGRAYDAGRTPEMVVIAPDGTLAYRGALDNTSGGDLEDVDEVKNYVDMAIEDLKAKRAVREPETKAWGCSVKYGG